MPKGIEELYDEYSKKDVILNGWLVAPDSTKSELADSLGGVSYEYVRKLVSRIESGEIPSEELYESANEELQRALLEHLSEQLGKERVGGVKTTLEEIRDMDEVNLYATRAGITNLWLLNREIGAETVSDLYGCAEPFADEVLSELRSGSNFPDDWNADVQRKALTRLQNADYDVAPREGGSISRDQMKEIRENLNVLQRLIEREINDSGAVSTAQFLIDSVYDNLDN